MFGQLSPLLGDLKISLLRTGIACSRRHSFGFASSPAIYNTTGVFIVRRKTSQVPLACNAP
jgi:hypothetical protein